MNGGREPAAAPQFENRLANESSPYLRQHAHNPVDWYPWGSEAFDEAARRGVPVLLSVGYSSCHWCHVMAHECFEDPEVAAVMNAGFVNIKVDREERPDVDAIYMGAVQAMTGRGGWPMTVFLTAAGEPFYGGTYFPREQFLRLMAAIGDVWTTRPDDVQTNVDALVRSLGQSAALQPHDDLPDLAMIDDALHAALGRFDVEWGGFGEAPKFPSTLAIELAMRVSVDHDPPGARQLVTTSLDAMASGGIYDHLGGGFCRYSVDRHWLVPHFEKMLYDQALAVRAYTRGWQLFGHERWRQVVAETVGYVLRDLHHPDGGFYSAEDADSVGDDGRSHEGLFYTWTPAEVTEVLGDDAHVALEWYEMLGEANFEGRWIPCRLHHRADLLRPAEVEAARARLFDARATRHRPGLDDKVIVEWCALMISALCEAAAAFERDDWRDAAVTSARFLIDELRSPDGEWLRVWHRDGAPRARHRALATDLAALVDAFTRLAELTGERGWIDEALATADTMLDDFFDVDEGGLFTVAHDAEQLIVAQKDLMDSPTPSANSLAALALYRLAALTGERRLANQADRIVQLLASVLERAPAAMPLTIAVADMRRRGITEVVIPGDRAELRRVFHERLRPDAVLAWGEPYDSPLWEGRTEGHAYVCRDYVCQLPVDTPDALRTALG